MRLSQLGYPDLESLQDMARPVPLLSRFLSQIVSRLGAGIR